MTVQEYAVKLRSNISKIIKGKDDKIDLVIMALLSGGHVLLDDVPGTGKTVLAKALARSVDAGFSRIQFTPDLLPSDITGIHFFNMKEQEFMFRAGPVFTNILLADEINRATPRTQSALLQCMEEKQVTIDGELFLIDKPFIVLATQNPVETAGTYPLPEAQLDRFMIKLSVGYSDRESEMQILDNSRAVHPVENLTAVTDKTELLEMMNRVENIKVNEAVRGYIADIGNASRHNSEIKLGLSTRGLIALKNMSQARAALRGREFVTPDDVKTVAPYVCVHRLICRSTVMRDPDSAKREILDKMIKELPVPTEQI
ncbi:MAG: AAA family ATPase [[Eubacterium] siraeum]|jgi:MoxR-like ATPase